MINKKEPSTPYYHSTTQKDVELNKINQILVVSDLHMSEGYSEKTFRWNRIENFTFDKTFARFLQKKSDEIRNTNSHWWLIINGDFIDYLRITSTPKSQEDLDEWKNVLAKTTSTKLPKEKNRVLSAFDEYAALWQKYVLSGKKSGKPPGDIRDELKYGFKTQDYKSVYRLMLAIKGHRTLYKALIKWLSDGHLITIVSGNHDEEFTQELVQAAMLWLLEDLHQQEYNVQADFSQRLNFEDHGIVIDGKICIEHGHRFESYTCADEDKHLDSEHHELFLASGSLFNRYLINRLELEIPYFDNIRPTTRVIGFLVRRHPFFFLKSILKMFETSWRLVRKRGTSKLVIAGFLKMFQMLPLICYALWLFITLLGFSGNFWQRIWSGPELIFGFSFALYIALPFFIIYFWGMNKIQQGLKLYFSEEKAKEKMTAALSPKTDAEKCYATFGHTHTPDIKNWSDNVVYINSGTWTPVFDYEGAQVRDDLTMTFVEFNRSNGSWTGKLARWVPFIDIETDMYFIEPRGS